MKMENTQIQKEIDTKEQELKDKIGEEKLSQIESMINEKGMDITIVDLNGRKIPLGAIQLELAIELRECLNDNVNTCFYTNYYFEHCGKRLNDYDELTTLDFSKDNEIYMKPDLYNERTARNHYKRFKEILYSPSVLNLSNDITNSLSNAINSVTKPQETEAPSSEGTPSETQNDTTQAESQPESTEDKKEDSKTEENKEENKDSENTTNDEAKKQQEEYNKIMNDVKTSIEEAKKNTAPPSTNEAVVDFEKVFSTPLDKDVVEFSPVKCLDYIEFSIFNPVPSAHALKGDLFYLKARTLEGPEIVITSNVKGFFINNSFENSTFDPRMSQRTSPCFSHSLVGLLIQTSPKFAEKLEEHINKILKTDPFTISQLMLPSSEWLSEQNGVRYPTEAFKSIHEEATSGYYGIDSKGSRDWNEEFQVCKDLPKDHIFQRIQRDRAFYKIYYDFTEAAQKGAIAIVNKSIPPLNPMDEENQHVFVYNQIFFSFAVDNKENYKDVSSNDSNPTYTATNHDMLGLKTLQVIDIDGVYIIATCHVNYKGYRVVAQSIIPGILTNTDQSTLTEFGSVDDGKTIYHTEEFTEVMKKVCDQLSIKEATILDEAEVKHVIPGSIDIKGIKGTDKRKYLLDLVRLTPRDTNYKGKNNTSALIRPELVRIYQKAKDIEYATTMEKQNEEPEIEEEKSEEKKFSEMTEEEKKQAIDDNKKRMEERRQKQIERLQRFEKHMKEAPQFSYNLNLFTNAKLAEGDYTEEEKQVRDLGNYINDVIIPRVVKNFEIGENVPTDNQSLSEIFHSQGLNIRYIGKVANSLSEGKLQYIRTLLERCMIVRSTAKVFNDLIRGVASSKASQFIAHLLNILLAPADIIQKLDAGENVDSEETNKEETKKEVKEVQETKQKKGKNKSKKNKKNKNHDEDVTKDEPKLFEIKSLYTKNFKSLIDDNKNSKYLSMKPSEFYQKITYLVKKRYGYDLPAKLEDNECRKTYKNKAALLRDLCIKIGLKIHSKNYNFEEISTEETKVDEKRLLPFTEKDVVEIVPKVKTFEIVNLDYKNFIGTAKAALKDGFYDQAFEFYNQAININLQVSGPINKEAVICLSQLANIHFKFGDYNQAVQLQTKCVILSEKLFGKIHTRTAQAYSSLANITTISNYTKAFEYMKRALYIHEMVCGDNHPEISSTYSSLGFMYLEIDDSQSALDCFRQSLYRNIAMYGEEHVQVANCYQIIASAYQNHEQFRQALEYQEKSHNILVRLYGENDPIVKNSLSSIDQYTKLSVQKEIIKKVEQRNQRPLGMNKKPKQGKKQDMKNSINLAQWLNMSKHPSFKGFQYNLAGAKTNK
ncbi:unnamed protein product [Moneuplotes crassus]|uniref:Clu domain-containing protein n=3 Tax=Euplotes crassus TaxID=5936 RepID=A0AAD1UBG3_EUPCR|nr:unnamed protein product [Moneuplotes crassus]